MTLISDLRALAKNVSEAGHHLHQVMPAAGQAITRISTAVEIFAGCRENELIEGLFKGTLPLYRAVNASRVSEGLPARDFALKGLNMVPDISWAGKAAVIEYRRILEAMFYQAALYPKSVPMFDGVNPGFDEKMEFLKASVPLAHGAAFIEVKIPVHTASFYTAQAVVSSHWEPEATLKLEHDSDLLGYSWVNQQILNKVAFQIWGGAGADIAPLLADDKVRELAATYFNFIDTRPEGGPYWGPYEEIIFKVGDALNTSHDPKDAKFFKLAVSFKYLPNLPEFRVIVDGEDPEATPAHVLKNHITRQATAQTGGGQVKFGWNEMTDIYKNVFFKDLERYVKSCIEGTGEYGIGN